MEFKANKLEVRKRKKGKRTPVFFPTSLGQYITFARKTRNMTQTMLAKEIGISSTHLSRIELGDNTTLETLNKIEKALNCKLILAIL